MTHPTRAHGRARFPHGLYAPHPEWTLSSQFSIDAYKAKRDFSRTPEPAPSDTGGAERLRFVVQRHEATRLHYDLRLEARGVLVSWAVPKGFSYVPAHKHLAVRTEDHPLEYLTFHGVIPKGEYGAGTMQVWDGGLYRLAKSGDLESALAAGKVELVLYGARLRGEWHMVKTGREERDWLLFKHKDRYARTPDEPQLALDLVGRTPDEWPSDPVAMVAVPAQAAFDDPAWAFELRLVGERLFLGRADGAPIAVGPGGGNWLHRLPQRVLDDLERVHAERFLLDGMLVALDETGRPTPAGPAGPADGQPGDGTRVYYAFDLVFYEDWSLTTLPLRERKAALAAVLPKGQLKAVLPVDHVVGSGRQVHAAAVAMGLSGSLAKRLDSPYRGGSRGDWFDLPSGVDPGGDVSHAPGVVQSRVQLKNLDKVFWPAEGITKGQLLTYYERIADSILPHLRNRPLHMLRYPDGIEGPRFYQKRAEHYLPDWIETAEVGVDETGESVRYIVCNDRDTLLYVVNLASIDLHPWMSSVGSLDSPDFGVIDLDPAGTDFSVVLRIANTVGRILRGAGMRPVVKTSGASGLHIAVGWRPGYTYEQSRMFCELVARMVVREHAEVATVERSVAKRGGKLYVDYLQNAREQTVVGPYVVRPVPGAQVSTPLDWDELSTDVRPGAFTIFNMPERVAQRGDLFRGALTEQHDLADSLERLAETAGL